MGFLRRSSSSSSSSSTPEGNRARAAQSAFVEAAGPVDTWTRATQDQFNRLVSDRQAAEAAEDRGTVQ
jgi:hypothetical protein